MCNGWFVVMVHHSYAPSVIHILLFLYSWFLPYRQVGLSIQNIFGRRGEGCDCAREKKEEALKVRGEDPMWEANICG